MFENYLKVAFRNLMRNKLYSIISIVGLAIGLGGCLLIVAYLSHELSFENMHQKRDRIYRLDGHWSVGDENVSMSNISAPIGPAIQIAFPEVEDMVRFRRMWDAKVELKKGLVVEEPKLLVAEPAILDIFTIPLKEGDPKKVLEAPFSMIISEDIAQDYFNNENPIGKTVKIDNEYECQITGVFENLSPNTQLKTNFFMSYSSLEKMGVDLTKWSDILNDYTFLLLHENADPKQLEKKIPLLLEQLIGKEGKSFKLKLQPLKRIYLHSDLSYELPPQGNLAYVYVFSCVAIVILLIACVNFINLATARTFHRMKEVGVRKVLGANRRQLIKQFLSESALITVISMFLGIIVFELAMPQLESFLGHDLAINIYQSPTMLISIVAMIVIVGFLSGSYPALVLSRHRPSDILRGGLFGGTTKSTFRRVLVTFQFIMAVSLVCTTFLIYKQIHYTRTTDMGFDKDNILILNFDEKVDSEKIQLMKREILDNTDVQHATAIRVPPGGGNYWLHSVHPENAPDDEYVLLSMFHVDYDFLSTFNVHMVAGRYFSEEFAADDENAVVINETAIKKYGIENPIGFKFHTTNRDFNVIGVVKDFHNVTLKNEIPPLALRIQLEISRKLALKLPTGDQAPVIAGIESVWNRILPDYPIDYEFLDDILKSDYLTEQKMNYLFLVFSLVAIVIACLGLFGLAAFMAERRTKEIGIRKVLGASVSSIVRLLSKEVVILIAVSNVVAWPIVYYIGSRWLQSFAYRTSIGWDLFVISGILVLTIGLLTVGFQAFRAAVSNPVDSLSYE
jgi:putative ABC transport system permease protein